MRTTEPAELLERHAELEATEAALAGIAGGGSVIVTAATAGLGKTSLLAHARASARRRGVQVVAAQGGELERRLPFGLVRQLFEEHLAAADRDERARLLDGPAHGIGALLEGRAEPVAREPLELIHAGYWFARNLARRAPLLLTLDDLHWADRPSLSFVLYLAQRAQDLPIVVAASWRPGEPEAPSDLLQRLAAEPAARTLAPAGLSPTGVERLVRRAHPAAEPAFTRAAHQATGGNPFLLRELLTALSAGQLAADEAAAREADRLVPASLLRWTLLRLDRLPPGGRELARAVAVLAGGASEHRARTLAGLDHAAAAEAADALAAIALLTAPPQLDFIHPLVRAAVYDDIPPADRALLHLRAARLLAREQVGAETLAGHLLHASRTGDAWVVAQLREAAAAALARGAGESASAWLRRALEEPPEREERGRILVELADAEALAGDIGAVARLAGALDAEVDPLARAKVHHRLGWVLWQAGQWPESREAFTRGLAEHPGGDDDLHARLLTGEFAVGGIVGTLTADELRRRSAQLERSIGVPRSASERERLIQLALARVFSAQDCDGARTLVVRAVEQGRLVEEEGVSFSYGVAGGCLLWCDGFAESERMIEQGIAHSSERGSAVGLAYARFGRAWLHWWQGRVAEAATDLEAAIEDWHGGWNMALPLAYYWLALALAELGDHDGALAAIPADADGPGVPEPLALAIRLARGRARLAADDAAGAWAALVPVVERAPAYPYLHNPACYPWRSEAALAALRVGEEGEARRLAQEELALARSFGAARPIGIALRAAGVVEGGDAGLALLHEAVTVLERSPATIERVRALVELGAALRRARRPLDAREPLRRALDAAERTGAVALRDRAQVELAAAGGRPRRARLTGIESLTASERRVVDMAAAGRTNPEIAQELFLARKTVEYHLGRAYRKLGVRGRAELARPPGEAPHPRGDPA